MFGLRFTIECQPRTKNGQPPQSTTGEARASCIHDHAVIDARRSKGMPGMKSFIPIANTGIDKTALTQNLRRISTSSWFSSWSRETVRGSSAIPQIGQEPGASRIICGCIGQVYSIFSFGAVTVTGSSAIPHFGHEPGFGARTSGCIGQGYSVASVESDSLFTR